MAEFRAALRRFLRRNERIARKSDLTPQRYLLLLMVKGAADGSERSTVTELAERMQLAQSTVTELVSRAEEAGLLEREQSHSDARVAHLRLTEEGERRLDAGVHRARHRAREPPRRVHAPRHRGPESLGREGRRGRRGRRGGIGRRGHDDLAVDDLVDRVDHCAIVAGPAVDGVTLVVDGVDGV